MVMSSPDERPDVQIFMALLGSNLWRPADSGRKVVLDWLQHIARTSLAGSEQASVQERRASFKSALAAEDIQCELHPCQASHTSSWAHHLSSRLCSRLIQNVLHRCFRLATSARRMPSACGQTRCRHWSHSTRCGCTTPVCRGQFATAATCRLGCTRRA